MVTYCKSSNFRGNQCVPAMKVSLSHESYQPTIQHSHSMVPNKCKSATKPWFLGPCFILGGRDSSTGWWYSNNFFFIFPSYMASFPLTHIFQDGYCTTNQSNSTMCWARICRYHGFRAGNSGDKQITWVDDLGDNSCSYPQFDLTPFQGMVFITSQLYPQIVKFGKCALVYCWFYHIIDEKAYSKV